MNYRMWTETAPEGEVFEDYWGNECRVRESCISCDGKGAYYREPCFNCGGFGWICVEVSVTE